MQRVADLDTPVMVVDLDQVKDNIVRLEKQLNPANKAASGWFGGYGENASLTTAKTNALASLNAARRHRYAGAPGLPSGATIPADLHGDTPVADVS